MMRGAPSTQLSMGTRHPHHRAVVPHRAIGAVRRAVDIAVAIAVTMVVTEREHRLCESRQRAPVVQGASKQVHPDDPEDEEDEEGERTQSQDAGHRLDHPTNHLGHPRQVLEGSEGTESTKSACARKIGKRGYEQGQPRESDDHKIEPTPWVAKVRAAGWDGRTQGGLGCGCEHRAVVVEA